MKRIVRINPGLWLFVVVSDNGEEALSLEVSSGGYPPTVTAEPRGSVLLMHTVWTTDVAEFCVGGIGRDCSFVKPSCFSSAYSAAEQFFREYGTPSGPSEQTETFWRALESKYAEIMESRLPQRADAKFDRCPTCNGTGVLLKGTKTQ